MHTSVDYTTLYRVDTMPAGRSLFANDPKAKWPQPHEYYDWDMWMRSDDIRRYEMSLHMYYAVSSGHIAALA